MTNLESVAQAEGEYSQWSSLLPTRLGLWSNELRTMSVDLAIEACRLLHHAGYSSAWVPGADKGITERLAQLIEGHSGLRIGTGIASIWRYAANVVGPELERISHRDPGSLIFGIGVSHAAFVKEEFGIDLSRPLGAVDAYLDDLESSLNSARRFPVVVAALGPKMLDIIKVKAEGAFPYLVTPAYTAYMRSRLGPTKMLIVQQTVCLQNDRSAAIASARHHLATYLTLPNYVTSWKRQGFGPDDLVGGGTERLLDAMVATGGPKDVARRLVEHLDAGADHVVVSISGEGRGGWRGTRATSTEPALTELQAIAAEMSSVLNS